MVKTSKEIINQAMKLSQCQNSRAFDWAFLVSILNSAYTKLYNDLMGYSNSFVKYFVFTENECELPIDCYKVEMVFRGDKDSPYILSQSSQNNLIPNTYYIENNVLRIVGKKGSERITVKYSTLPKTLTSPDEAHEIDVSTWGDYAIDGMDDQYIYFTNDASTFKYDIANDVLTDMDAEGESLPYFGTTFNNYPLSYTTGTEGQVLWNGNDVTDRFIEYDTITGGQMNITKMVWDNTHIAIQYDNGDLYYMNGDWEKERVNPYLYLGRYFKVTDILAVCGNDETGRGFLVKEYGTNKILYVSFVPDTVLNYPNGVLFDIVEDMVAVQLQALTGMDNTGLREKLEDDKMSFYSSLQRSQQGIRIRNDSNRGRVGLW